MLARHVSAGFSGLLITAALLWFMQFLLLQDLHAKPKAMPPIPICILRTHVDTQIKTRVIEPPPRIGRPPLTPRTNRVAPDPAEPRTAFNLPGPAPLPISNFGVDLSRLGTPQADNDLVPIVRPQPVYPRRAVEGGIEGFVDLRFTVTAAGFTQNIEVIHASDRMFINDAIRAAEKFKYRPRVVNGENVAVYSVETRISFKMER